MLLIKCKAFGLYILWTFLFHDKKEGSHGLNVSVNLHFIDKIESMWIVDSMDLNISIRIPTLYCVVYFLKY